MKTVFFASACLAFCPLALSDTWIAGCNNLRFNFDRTTKEALLYLNTTLGFLQVARGTIAVDNGVVLRAPLTGNSVGYNGLALTEIELNLSARAINVLYRNPTNGVVASGTFCTTNINVWTMSPSRRPTTKRTLKPSRRPTKKPTSRRVTKLPSSRKPTMQPNRKPTTKPTRAPSRRPTIKRTSAPSKKTTTQPNKNPTVKPSIAIPPNSTYITPDKASEIVIIPDPPKPTMITSSNRINCPHLSSSGNLLDWHSSTTWGTSGVPTAGKNVTLPVNAQVLISKTIDGILGFITVPQSSELIIGENSQGIQISALGFDVQGRLTAGSETCRIETPITVTLYGARSNDITTNAKAPIFKGIIVSGRLDLHGKRYYRTWTRLAQKANIGDSYVVLQHAVNWEYGQAFVLVTTAVKDSREWHQNEICYVKSVTLGGSSSGFGAIVYVQSAIQFTHYANKGYQAEVGLLSRMILVQGAASDSEPTDPDALTCTEWRWKWGDYKTHCPNTELTGYGGHIMIYNGGKGYAEGIQLYRMGQTNVLGRYPFHFHVLGNSCQGCYLKDSSFYRSFYRCVSIHGTHNLTITENVGYDVTGYCYYLEDGVEEDNTLSFNLAAHIHYLGTAPWGGGQTTDLNVASAQLTLPADVSAAGFYITNVHNNVIGNAASGGWAGFAFPSLVRPVGLHRSVNMRPSSRTSLIIDGNTAHSTGWYWYHASGFYFGGSLYFDGNGILTYNAGRDMSWYYGLRSTCTLDMCLNGGCDNWCMSENQAWVKLTNSKVFLVPSNGLNSWFGRMEIIGFEVHDVGLSMELLESGIWINNVLAECRSGEPWLLPSGSQATSMKGNGFYWYDTGQKHIITSATFRNCGYKSDLFNQYDSSTNRGCDDSPFTGCDSSSTTFGFLTHSDQYTPEIMQATRNITFQKCGRRFYLHDWRGDNLPSTVSGRTQNWHDVDGSVSGFQAPSLIGSGQSAAGLWWRVDSQVVYDPQGPLTFIKKNNGPRRSLGHIQLSFDLALHNRVGNGLCGNGDNNPCLPVGYIKHFGPMFVNDAGLPVTANPSISGPIGGYGWLLRLTNGAPRTLTLSNFEIPPESPLILGLSYPKGTSITITAFADYCYSSDQYYTCSEVFRAVSSHDQVRTAGGNAYYLDANGFLTVRLISSAQTFTGNPNWIFPTYDTIGKWGSWYALDRFSKGNITLPRSWGGSPNLKIEIKSNCAASSQNSAYCSSVPSEFNLTVCNSGYTQVAYDTCCSLVNSTMCQYATG